MKKRFALVIGAAHSGTTRFFRQIGSHPQVIPCRVKEPNFFTDDRKWALGLEWYRTLWDFHEPDERVAMEASSDYTRHPRVPCPARRIAQVPAGFRFLYLMRDPLARVEAHHAQAVSEGRAPREADARTLAEAIEVTRYATQLELYREHFPAQDFLLLRAEDLESDPVATLRQACRFLEIDPSFGFPELQRPNARPGGAPAAPRGWLARLRRRSRRARPHPPRAQLSAEHKVTVLRELRGELARLEAEWSFDLSGWRLEP
jgi:hypothetical protein